MMFSITVNQLAAQFDEINAGTVKECKKCRANLVIDPATGRHYCPACRAYKADLIDGILTMQRNNQFTRADLESKTTSVLERIFDNV